MYGGRDKDGRSTLLELKGNAAMGVAQEADNTMHTV